MNVDTNSASPWVRFRLLFVREQFRDEAGDWGFIVRRRYFKTWRGVEYTTRVVELPPLHFNCRCWVDGVETPIGQVDLTKDFTIDFWFSPRRPK